jgi:aconitate hydratase
MEPPWDFFPLDEESIHYYQSTGRSEAQCCLIESYFRAQELFGIPERGQIDYTDDLELDLSSVVPSVSGPKRPQDRIDVPQLKERFDTLFETAPGDGGFGQDAANRSKRISISMNTPAGVSAVPAGVSSPSEESYEPIQTDLFHGSVLIAAITSCTNTSNPSVMIAAGLVAKKANEKGLQVAPYVKTSLAPGSPCSHRILELDRTAG